MKRSPRFFPIQRSQPQPVPADTQAGLPAGWFDGHVHAAPDVIPRASDDLGLLAHYVGTGAAGFVLKAHHESTVGRAHVASRISGLSVLGGVALNHSVGGLSPATVYAALASGGRVVWMPTVDAGIHAAMQQPRLSDSERRVPTGTLALPPVDQKTDDVVRRIVSMVADNDAILATGHISAAECRWLVDVALAAGVHRIIATHPAYTVPGMAVDEVRELASRGVHIEITAHQLLHQPGCTPAHLRDIANAAGDRLLLTSDVGQVDSPPPAEALGRLGDALVAEGVDQVRVTEAMTTTPCALFLGDRSGSQ